MANHATIPENANGLHWSETHCDEDVVNFNHGVRALREALEPKGCKVISTMLLREPSAQLKSEWEYFASDNCNKSTPLDWAKIVPDEELRWAMTGSAYWSDGLLHAPGAADISTFPECGDPKAFKQVKDCDAMMSDFEHELSQIDHVGISDTPEAFAQWWLILSEMAGFKTDAAQLAKHSNPSGGSRAEIARSTTAAQIDEIKALNPCAKRAYMRAYTRHTTEVGKWRVKWNSTESEDTHRVGSLGDAKHRVGTASDSSDRSSASFDDAEASVLGESSRRLSAFDRRVQTLLSGGEILEFP